MTQDLKTKIAEAIRDGADSDGRVIWDTSAQAALQAIHDAGYAVVPREPTEAMLQAVVDANVFGEVNNIIVVHATRTGTTGLKTNPLPAAYRAMLNASQPNTEEA